MSKESFVYVIAPLRDEKPVKIGSSNNPWYRITEHQCGSPILLRLCATVGPFAVRYEAYEVERVFREGHTDNRLHGEWYDLTIDYAVKWLRDHYGVRS